MIWPGAGSNLRRDSNRKYLFGMGNDILILSIKAHGDVMDKSRPEILIDNILVFDPMWPTSTSKKLTFRNQTPEVRDRFLEWFHKNVGKYTRFLQRHHVDYGVMNNEVQIINQMNGMVDISVTFISLLEWAI